MRRQAWWVPAVLETLRCLVSGERRALWRPSACDSMAAASKRLGLARCLMLMGRETGLA